MKKESLLFCLALIISTFSTVSFAGSGSAVIPYWNSNGSIGLRGTVQISNTTNNDINVTVTFYGKDGTIQASGLTYYNFTNSDSQLAAHSTGVIQLATPSDYGYGVIEWSNETGDNDSIALVAHSSVITVNGSSWRADVAIPINGGLPF